LERVLYVYVYTSKQEEQMITQELISTTLPTLSPDDTGERALSLMEENKVHQLPLVSDEHYVGLVQENDLLEWDTPESPLTAAAFLNYKPAVFSGSHPFDALRIAHDMQLSVVPVIDADNRYVGAITQDGLLKYIAENSGLDSPGGIIVLEVAPRNYTLYEIARICENEDVVIVNTQVHTNPHGMLEVTIKMNRTDLDAVVASFERHEYNIKEVYGKQNNNDDTEGRYNLLMNYINM